MKQTNDMHQEKITRYFDLGDLMQSFCSDRKLFLTMLALVAQDRILKVISIELRDGFIEYEENYTIESTEDYQRFWTDWLCDYYRMDEPAPGCSGAIENN